mgnify:CR=1 FL=1
MTRQTSPESLAQKLLDMLDRLITPVGLSREDGLRYWQARILMAILLASATFGFFVYVPSVLLSIAESLWSIVIIDTIMYALVLYVYWSRDLAYKVRAIVVSGLSYVLGLVLLIILGPFGAGPIWIFAFPLMAGVLMGYYPAAVALVINAATLAVIGVCLSLGLTEWNELLGHSALKWTVISLNFMLLNVVSTLSVTAILKSLDRRQAEVLEANKQLKKEIEERAKAEEERHSLEAQLRQAQKMEALGTLAGGIAHDFNNILYTIMGYTELTAEDLDPESDLYNNLQQVLVSSRRARDLVRQILAFSRQDEAGSQPVMVKPIAKEVLKMLQATLPAKINVQGDIQSDARIVSNPTHVHQILMNLCTNAGHAMQPGGGTLTVRLHNAHLDQSDANHDPDMTPGPHVRLTVADTGHGIESGVLERIFDPFFTTKGPGEGTGMGLSVVHGIVKQLGGSLRVYSKPGEGTEFNVYLPALEGYEAITLGYENALP